MDDLIFALSQFLPIVIRIERNIQLQVQWLVLTRRRVPGFFHRSPSSTVAKAVPCNHRVKYLDGQWEDNVLYAEEPGYVVVRREIDASYPNPNEQHGW